MMYTQCDWLMLEDPRHAHCTAQGLNIIIMGCLNQHINELVLCGLHTDDWEDIGETHDAYCVKPGCSLYVETWEKVKVHKASREWLTQHHS